METSEGFEIPNSGCDDDEPEDAGPGMLGNLLTKYIHVKEKVSGAHSPKSGTGSTLSTPSTPRGVGSHRSTLEDEHTSGAVDLDTARAGPGRRHEDRGIDNTSPTSLTAGSGRRHEDRGIDNTSPTSLTGSSRSDEKVSLLHSPRSNGRSLRDGTPPSPSVRFQDLGERIIDKLPFTNANPYAVADPSRPPAAIPQTQYSAPPSPSVHHTAPSSPRVFGKPKTEGLMTRIAEKFHLHNLHQQDKSPSPRAAAAATPSPRATSAATTVDTPAAAIGTPVSSTFPSDQTGMPLPTEGGPSTTIGTATGPKEN